MVADRILGTTGMAPWDGIESNLILFSSRTDVH